MRLLWNRGAGSPGVLAARGTGPGHSQWKKWIAIFLVVTVVIPTCLGIVGTVLGIGGGILGALAPFILSLF